MYLSLVQYEEDAIKTIKKYMGSRHITDDNVGFIMYYMMRADEKFNPELGFQRNTYRICCARYGCLKLFKMKQKKVKAVNIQNWELPNKCKNIEKVDNIDEIRSLIEQTGLNPQEKKVFEFLMLGYSFKDIASELGVSKQRVDQIISNIKKKVK